MQQYRSLRSLFNNFHSENNAASARTNPFRIAKALLENPFKDDLLIENLLLLLIRVALFGCKFAVQLVFVRLFWGAMLALFVRGP